VIAELSYEQLREDVVGWIKLWSIHKLTLHGDQTRLTLKDAGRDAARSAAGTTAKILAALLEPVTLRQLWRGSDIELPELCEHLSRFVERKWVAAGTLHRDPAAASLEASIAMLETNLKRMIGKDLVREKLAELYVRARQPEKACEQYQALADETAGRGDWRAAGEYLTALVGLQPGNLAALSQAVGILRQHGENEEAGALAFQVAQALFAQKKEAELKLVAGILESIPGAAGHAPEVRGDISSLSGLTEKAAAEYLTAVARYEERGLTDRAGGAAAKAAGCGVAAEAVQRRVQHAKGSAAASRAPDQARKPGRRSGKPMLQLVAALVLAVAAGVVYWSGWVPGTRATTRADRAKDTGAKAAAAPGLPGAQATTPPAAKIVVAAQNGSSVGTGGAAAVPAQPGGDRDARPTLVIEEGSAGSAAGAASRAEAPQPQAAQDAASPASPQAAAELAGPARDPTAQAGKADLKAPVPLADADLLAALPPSLPGAPQVCVEHARHVVARRSLRECDVRFADACSLSAHAPDTGEKIAHLPGRPGWRWTVSWHGDEACHWSGGASPVLYNGLGTGRPERLVILWRLPEDAEAVAVGEGAIAFRRGRTTLVRDHAGALVAEREGPAWSEGVLAGSSLVVGEALVPGREPRSLTVLDRELLQVVRVIRPPADR
jgi:hypothetical protein